MTLAVLPMYDWPEVREATDDLWRAIAGRLSAAGLDAPVTLDRSIDREVAWHHADLLVGQTCGLPFVSGVDRSATVLGTFDYDHAADSCGPGDYCSVIVARPGTGESLEDHRGGVAAYNGRDSQSGHAALAVTVAPLARDGAFFSRTVETGTHRASVVAVGSGDADVAAIDAVSWQLALDHEPVARDLVVIGTTPCSPGLPLITNKARIGDVGAMNTAIEASLDDVDSSSLAALHIGGYLPRRNEEYDVLTERLEQAAALGYPALD